MAELPSKLDGLFNIYLNILPFIEPVGFWSLLLGGVAVVLYIVAVATLHLVGLQKLINASGSRYDYDEYVIPPETLLQSSYLYPLKVLPNESSKDKCASKVLRRSYNNLASLSLELEPAALLDQTYNNSNQLCCYEVDECSKMTGELKRSTLPGDVIRIR